MRDDLAFYTWENWDIPRYEERLKESYWIMRDAYGSY
jgi:hypothetical protein